MRPDAQRAIGGLLQPAVDGGVDLVAGVLRRRAETPDDLEAHHLGDVRRLDVGERAVRLRSNYFLRGRIGRRRVDEAELAHAAQHVAAAFGGARRIGDRVETRRRLRHARERRRLAERELVERFAEVGFRRRRHAIGALAEEDHVEIQREDFLLGELALEALA